MRTLNSHGILGTQHEAKQFFSLPYIFEASKLWWHVGLPIYYQNYSFSIDYVIEGLSLKSLISAAC
jgi:hypothetical protein